MTPSNTATPATVRWYLDRTLVNTVQLNLPGATVEQLSATGIRADGANGYQQLLLSLHNSGTTMLALRPTALQMPTPLSRKAVGNNSGM